MKTKSSKPAKNSVGGVRSAGVVLLICFIIAVCLFNFVFGNPANFQGGDPNNHPLPGNLLGTIYKGGVIVPVLQTLFLTVLVLSVERWFAIRKANGKGNLTKFVRNVKDCLEKNDLEGARALCAKQRGSVANVVLSALETYSQVENDSTLNKEQSVAAIQKRLEEATALELPTLEQNLPVIATMTTGISEALINTAFGIATGACAVISYNYYTSKIDKLTYSIDEVGFTIVAAYNVAHK